MTCRMTKLRTWAATSSNLFNLRPIKMILAPASARAVSERIESWEGFPNRL